jgi:hypothetical protein
MGVLALKRPEAFPDEAMTEVQALELIIFLCSLQANTGKNGAHEAHGMKQQRLPFSCKQACCLCCPKRACSRMHVQYGYCLTW